MAALLIATGVLLGILCIDVWSKRGRVLAVGVAFLVFAYALIALTSFGMQVPSPVESVGRLIGVW